MKVLKKKFRKKPGGDKLKHPISLTKLIKIKPKQGHWCEYYEGRLPSPMECSINKETPESFIFKNGEKIVMRRTPNCPNCKRSPKWESWKKGDWAKIKEAITNAEDLTDMDPPYPEMI